MIEEFMAVLSQEECQHYWFKERTRILLEGFLKDIMFQPGMYAINTISMEIVVDV